MAQLQRANQLYELPSITTATCAARRATFLGRPFRVVPAVFLRSQVLRNNLGATFLPAEEITDDWAAQWNGTPVLVGPHPSERGVTSSGRTPEIWNERGVGWIFAARAETARDGVRRLVGEVWLDESRAESVAGFQAILTCLDAGQNVELSTGFPTQSDEASGVHNGEVYELILHPAGADHLIISTEMTGACAVADGCGLGANKREKPMDDAAAQAAAAQAAAAAAAGNDAPTQSVGGTPHPASDFAYAPAGSNPSDWKLPIFDAEHVRAALARLNQAQIPAASMASVKRKIKAAAAQFNVDAASLNEGGFKALLAKVTELFGNKPDRKTLTTEDREALQLQRVLEIAGHQGLSDRDKAEALEEALEDLLETKFPGTEMLGTEQVDVIVADVFSDEKLVVWWVHTPLGAMPAGDVFYRSAFADAGNGEFTVSAPELVQRVTRYEPVAATAPDAAAQQTHNEGEHMADEKKDTDVLAAVANLAKQVEQLAGRVETLATAGAPAEIAGLKRSIGELATKFEKMETVTSAAINERERERQQLVKDLAGNFRVPFTAAELESKPIDELRKLTEMSKPENYAARGGPHGSQAEQRFVEPQKYWEKPNKKEGE